MTQGKAVFWYGLFTGLVVLTAVALWTFSGPELPDDRGPAPAFTLTNQHGETVQDEDLRGQVVVASFVFTRCFLECPLLVQRQLQLQQEVEAAGLAEAVVMVSFTVDPAHDTPEVLRGYARQLGIAQESGWQFLTGGEAQLQEIVVDGFKLAVQPLDDEARREVPGAHEHDAPIIIHSSRFVIMDRDWHIRGYHDGMAEELDELLAILKRLARL